MEATDLLIEEREGPTAEAIDEVEKKEEEEDEDAFIRSVCRQVSLLGKSPSIHLGISEEAFRQVLRLGGKGDVSIYDDGTVIEGIWVRVEGTELRAQRPSRNATAEESALLEAKGKSRTTKALTLHPSP